MGWDGQLEHASKTSWQAAPAMLNEVDPGTLFGSRRATLLKHKQIYRYMGRSRADDGPDNFQKRRIVCQRLLL